MATTFQLSRPHVNLCDTCLFRKILFHIGKNDNDNTEAILRVKCASDWSEYKELDLGEISEITAQGDLSDIEQISTRITDCSIYTPAHKLEITDVAYDIGTSTLDIDYSVSHGDGATDMKVYISSEYDAIDTVVTVANGTGTSSTVIALPVGDYSVWLSVGSVMSFRKFFSLVAS